MHKKRIIFKYSSVIFIILIVLLLCFLIYDNHSSISNIYIENNNDVTSAEVLDFNSTESLEICWLNNSDKILYFSSQYKIYRNEDGKWEELQKLPDYDWLDVLPFVNPSDKRSFKYDLSFFNLGKNGTYKIELSYRFDNNSEKQSIFIVFDLSR